MSNCYSKEEGSARTGLSFDFDRGGWMFDRKNEGVGRGLNGGLSRIKGVKGSTGWAHVNDDQASWVCYWAVVEVRLPSSLGDWETEALSILKIAFERTGLPVPWEEHSRVAGDTYTSQKDRGKIDDCRSFLVKAPRKGGQEGIDRCWLKPTVNSSVLSFLRQVLEGDWVLLI